MTENRSYLIDRLDNWKFTSATSYLEEESEEINNLVNLLSGLFGNCGWFDGSIGNLVQAVVDPLWRN